MHINIFVHCFEMGKHSKVPEFMQCNKFQSTSLAHSSRVVAAAAAVAALAPQMSRGVVHWRSSEKKT